jgi:iron(III) transport system ATP-binding protein
VSDPILAAESVRKVYRSGGTDVVALKSLDLTVPHGQFLAVMGASGSGKTTLLNCLSGLDEIDGGRVIMDGHSIHELSDAKRTRHRAETMGFIFQAFNLIPVFTATENVELPLLLAKIPEREARRRARETLARVGLGHRLDRYPPELSGGEQQRVALARALAPHPAVVLLDEPFSSLDETLRAQVRADTVAVLRETGTTSMLVTHDQTEALSTGDRVVVMRKGVIEQDDLPHRVFERPASRFVASFMGDADFLPANVRDALLTCEIGVVSTVPGWGAVNVDVDVVLRPHEVALTPAPDSPARVIAVEYHGAFVLHTVRLGSGRTLRSWQAHSVRYPVGTNVAVTVVPGVSPTLLVGDTAVTAPPR